MLIKSPLIYQGNKHSLIPLLLDKMPKCPIAYDMFGGSGCVAASMQASGKFKEVRYSETSETTFNIVDALAGMPISSIRRKITSYMNRFKLNAYDKDAFLLMREAVNANPCPIGFWLLARHSHSNLLRFNQRGEFNAPFGKRSIASRRDEVDEELVMFRASMGQVARVNTHYANVLNCIRKAEFRKSFFYFDPPYLASGGNTYSPWKEEDDAKLMRNLDTLTRAGSLWMLSNVFEHRHFENKKLKRWSRKYNVQHLDKTYTFANAYDDNNHTKEVLITNY